MTEANCIFCKIAAGAIPSRKVYEDDELFVFHDIAPWAPVHFLMVPKKHIPSMAQVQDEHAELLGRMMTLAPRLALEQGCKPYPDGGFRMECGARSRLRQYADLEAIGKDAAVGAGAERVAASRSA